MPKSPFMTIRILAKDCPGKLMSKKLFEWSKVQLCIYVDMWFDKASRTFSALDNPFRVLCNCLLSFTCKIIITVRIISSPVS